MTRSSKDIIAALQKYNNDANNPNNRYSRQRRYDSSSKYRIGPTFVTKAKLAHADKAKPGKIKLPIIDPWLEEKKGIELLTYLWAFTDQPEKTEIDLNLIKFMLDNGADVNVRDDVGQTILHAIVRDWHPDVARFAIENGAEVDVQDDFGRSPLHLAAALNYTDMAKVLLVKGADANLETYREFQTPVHYAAKYNSLDVLKLLLSYQGCVLSRDYRNRTALFVAAEKGSDKTSDFLIEMGVPSAIYDTHGNFALSHLVENIPSVALQALGQYIELTKKKNKQCQMYLSALETVASDASEVKTYARTPLSVITAYMDIDLIMHPVIQSSIEVKWKKFGRKDTIRKLVITLLYIIVWCTVALLFNQHSVGAQRDWADYSWELLFELPILMFAIYFLVKDFIHIKDSVTYYQEWMNWKTEVIRSQYVHCHPSWPSEREKVANEEENLKMIPSLTRLHVFWFAYECINFIILCANIVTRVLAVIYFGDNKISLAHSLIFNVNMFCAFIRIIKIMLRFRYFAVFLKVASLATTSFIQIVFLYIQFYIPFVAAFWVWFEDPVGYTLNNTTLPMNGSNQKLPLTMINTMNNQTKIDIWTLKDFFFNVYTSSFEQEELYRFQTIDQNATHILVSLFHVFTTFIALSIIIAFITAKFSTNVKRCIAEASLLQASVVLHLERKLSKENKQKLAEYYTHCCTPLSVDDQALPEEVHGRNAELKLHILELQVKSIADQLRVFETNFKDDVFNREIALTHKTIYNSIACNTWDLNRRQDKTHMKVSANFKYLARRYEYIPQIVPQVIKSAPKVPNGKSKKGKNGKNNGK